MSDDEKMWFDEGARCYRNGGKLEEALGFLALAGGTKQDIIAFSRGFGVQKDMVTEPKSGKLFCGDCVENLKNGQA